jgi:hypothetical protein
MIAGLPGVEALATAQMRKEMERLEIPPIREFIEMLDDAGADLYGWPSTCSSSRRTTWCRRSKRCSRPWTSWT